MTQELSAFASTSPMGGEKCPVCLRRLRNGRLAKPENCDHYFCFTCIHEWAKNVNTCPVDRIQFNNIEVYSCIRGKLLDKVYIPNTNVIEVSTDPNDVTYCEICHQCDREESLLLCDGCDKGYHLACLSPPLDDIPEGDWYCSLCLPIIYEQYDPSLVLESDFENNHIPNSNSHSEDDSSINVVDSDSDDSGMDWRPTRSRNQLVLIKESSESSEDDKSTNQDSNDTSSDDVDTFHRRRASSKVTISMSTEESESDSVSDVDVVSIGESSSRSHSRSKMSMELGDQFDGSSDEEESDFDEHVQPIGKHSKSSQRIESDSDSAHANDNFHSQDPVDDLGDIQPIGNRQKRCKNSQRIESDSDSIDTNENSHSRESRATTTKGESSKSTSKSIDITWKNTSIPLTRLKWKIPRKASVSDGAISDFANRDDTTDQGSTNDLHNDAAMKILHSEAVVKLEPGMEKRVEDRVAKLEPGMEMSQRKANVCSDLHVPDNITMTLSPKTNSTYVSESLPAPRANQSDTESEKSRLHAEDTEAGPSTGFPSSSDVLEAMADDVGKHSRKQNHRRRRSKRNRRKVQLADCPNSRKVETWFDFRDIETHLGSRRRTSNTRQQQPQVPSVTQSDPYYGTSELTWLNTFAYSGHRYKHDLRDRPPLLPSPHPSHAPPLMNFVPVTSYNHTCVSGQPPLSYSSYPPGPYACPPFPPPPILGGPPPQPPPNVLPQPQVSMSYLGSSDAASACGNNVGFSTHHDQGPCVAEVQKPKIKRPNQRQRRRRKKKTKLVLTVTRKSPKKSEESSVPVTKAVLAKRRRRSQRKKRKREEWKIKKRELKEAGQWPRPKRRRDLFSPGSPRDPTYSPSKWDPKSIAQSDGCMTRARTAATNTPRKQAMREAVREAYRHEDHGEGLRFAREILAKQGRTSDTDTRRSDNTTTAGADTVESGMGNGNGYLTTPIREGSKSERPSSTPQSGYLERRGSGIGGQPRHPVASIPETPPSTVAAQYENRTRLTSDSNVTGPSTSSYERERDYCMRIVDEVKRRSLPSRRMLSSVLVTPVQKAIVMRSAASEEKSEHEKPVRDQGEGRTNSSDLIDQLCQNLDDLQNRNNIIQRDGSIVPIKEGNTSPPPPVDPLLSLSSTTPSPRMTSSVSPATTPKRRLRSCDHRPTPATTYPTNQNHTMTTATTCSASGKKRVWVTPEKWRDHYNNSSSSHETFDSSCKSEVNGSESRSNTSSPCAVRSSQEGRKSRVVKRILSSDSEPGRENGLPDYVTFVPDTPTKADSYQSPFFYSETYPTTTTTATTRMCTMSDASSNSGGIQMSSNSGISCVTSTTCTTGDASSFLSGNSDAVSSSTSTDDPKWYIKRLLKQHYHLGNISAYQYWRILERASRRVEQGQVMAKYTDKSRIRRLVDDYVEAYINAAAKFNAE